MRSARLSSAAATVAVLVVLTTMGPTCSTVVAGALQDRGTTADQDACTPDVFRLCSAYIPDEAQILACLQSKREQLSPACGLVFTPAHDKHRRRTRRPPS